MPSGNPNMGANQTHSTTTGGNYGSQYSGGGKMGANSTQSGGKKESTGSVSGATRGSVSSKTSGEGKSTGSKLGGSEAARAGEAHKDTASRDAAQGSVKSTGEGKSNQGLKSEAATRGEMATREAGGKKPSTSHASEGNRLTDSTRRSVGPEPGKGIKGTGDIDRMAHEIFGPSKVPDKGITQYGPGTKYGANASYLETFQKGDLSSKGRSLNMDADFAKAVVGVAQDLIQEGLKKGIKYDDLAQPFIREVTRNRAIQQRYYDKRQALAKKGIDYAAAAPGQSGHQFGVAMDVYRDTPIGQALREAALAGDKGLETAKPSRPDYDPNHVQLAGSRGNLGKFAELGNLPAGEAVHKPSATQVASVEPGDMKKAHEQIFGPKGEIARKPSEATRMTAERPKQAQVAQSNEKGVEKIAERSLSPPSRPQIAAAPRRTTPMMSEAATRPKATAPQHTPYPNMVSEASTRESLDRIAKEAAARVAREAGIKTAYADESRGMDTTNIPRDARTIAAYNEPGRENESVAAAKAALANEAAYSQEGQAQRQDDLMSRAVRSLSGIAADPVMGILGDFLSEKEDSINTEKGDFGGPVGAGPPEGFTEAGPSRPNPAVAAAVDPYGDDPSFAAQFTAERPKQTQPMPSDASKFDAERPKAQSISQALNQTGIPVPEESRYKRGDPTVEQSPFGPRAYPDAPPDAFFGPRTAMDEPAPAPVFDRAELGLEPEQQMEAAIQKLGEVIDGTITTRSLKKDQEQVPGETQGIGRPLNVADLAGMMGDVMNMFSPKTDVTPVTSSPPAQPQGPIDPEHLSSPIAPSVIGDPIMDYYKSMIGKRQKPAIEIQEPGFEPGKKKAVVNADDGDAWWSDPKVWDEDTTRISDEPSSKPDQSSPVQQKIAEGLKTAAHKISEAVNSNQWRTIGDRNAKAMSLKSKFVGESRPEKQPPRPRGARGSAAEEQREQQAPEQQQPMTTDMLAQLFSVLAQQQNYGAA